MTTVPRRRDNSRVVTSVGLTFFSSTLKLEQAVKNHLDQLKDLAGEISARLDRIQDGTANATERNAGIGSRNGARP